MQLSNYVSIDAPVFINIGEDAEHKNRQLIACQQRISNVLFSRLQSLGKTVAAIAKLNEFQKSRIAASDGDKKLNRRWRCIKLSSYLMTQCIIVAVAYGLYSLFKRAIENPDQTGNIFYCSLISGLASLISISIFCVPSKREIELMNEDNKISQLKNEITSTAQTFSEDISDMISPSLKEIEIDQLSIYCENKNIFLQQFYDKLKMNLVSERCIKVFWEVQWENTEDVELNASIESLLWNFIIGDECDGILTEIRKYENYKTNINTTTRQFFQSLLVPGIVDIIISYNDVLEQDQRTQPLNGLNLSRISYDHKVDLNEIKRQDDDVKEDKEEEISINTSLTIPLLQNNSIN